MALKEFRATKGSLGYLAAMRRSKDPTTFTVLFEDTAAVIGLLVAFVGIATAQAFDLPELDGAASIGVGLVLAATAVFLARESKGLLIGEPALPEVQACVLRIAGEDPAVHRANGEPAVRLGPNQVVAALSAEFEDRLTSPEIEACVARIEDRVKAALPEVTTLFVKPQTAGAWQRRRARIDAVLG